MMSALTSISSWVWLAAGDLVKVVLMNSALRSEKCGLLSSMSNLTGALGWPDPSNPRAAGLLQPSHFGSSSSIAAKAAARQAQSLG